MYNHGLFPRFTAIAILISYILLLSLQEEGKSDLKSDLCKVEKHEMNNNRTRLFLKFGNRLNAYKHTNIARINSIKPGFYALAFRVQNPSQFGFSLLKSNRYSTDNYKAFLKMSNLDLKADASTFDLDLDVYRNDSKPTGRVTFSVTGHEKRLFELLTECVKFFNLDMDLRVVGGWVRDKLLRIDNKDIDVAIPKMTGVEFCDYLNKFTQEKHGFSRTVGVVKRCPEQSKHLETATMNVLGFDVDFVNLRSEDYTADSRIPVMRIGTPLEDAMRRDFTVNSLFFNISKNVIEDFTTSGIDDLKAGLIRTCSPPFETFMDDPLRAIRAVRFSSRLNFTLDPELVKSLNDDVLNALDLKVSRSRISQELENILAKSDVSQAFGLMYRFRILHVLLNLPFKGGRMVEPVSGVTDEMLAESCSLMAKLRPLRFPEVDYKYLFLSALVVPTRGLPPVGKVTVADYLIKERLKLPNKYSTSAHTISEGSAKFTDFLANFQGDRVNLGVVIRSIGPLWKESLLMSLAESEGGSTNTPKSNADYAKFQKVVSLAMELGVSEAYNFKAPITGQELRDVLPRISSGPEFKGALEFQVREMLRDEAVTREELRAKLESQFKHLL